MLYFDVTVLNSDVTKWYHSAQSWHHNAGLWLSLGHQMIHHVITMLHCDIIVLHFVIVMLHFNVTLLNSEVIISYFLGCLYLFFSSHPKSPLVPRAKISARIPAADPHGKQNIVKRDFCFTRVWENQPNIKNQSVVSFFQFWSFLIMVVTTIAN